MKQIEANERAINVAIQKGDVAAFKALVAEDAVAMDGAGPMAVFPGYHSRAYRFRR